MLVALPLAVPLVPGTVVSPIRYAIDTDCCSGLAADAVPPERPLAPEPPGALDVPDAIVPGSSLTTPGIPIPAPTLSAIGSWANTLPAGTGTVDSPAGKDEAQCSQMMDRSVTVWCTS
uniref:Uncharacterized protein n=1 Tax=Anopheles melas TaxID=34690 RepID=A0A182U534_9DIPT